MYFCTIASGSSGNCTLVSEGDTNILIDAGISMRRTAAALTSLGVSPADITAILITHEHSDHISGLQRFSKKYGVEVYAGEVTAGILVEKDLCESARMHAFTPGETFTLGSISVKSFRTPHDTPESVGYRLTAGESSLAFVTDLGYMPESVMDCICGADAAVLEANHDVGMLRSGPYPYYLKRRILGDGGHLSNEAAAECAVKLAKNGAKRIVLAHLSRENNLPSLALAAVGRALENEKLSCALSVAPRDVPGEKFGVEACLM